MASLWERTRHAFERILEESKRATERVAETATEAGEAAKARIERARLERTLFKRFAELGNRVYERSQAGAPGGGLLDEPQVKELLEQIRTLDQDLKKLQGERESRP